MIKNLLKIFIVQINKYYFLCSHLLLLKILILISIIMFTFISILFHTSIFLQEDPNRITAAKR